MPRTLTLLALLFAAGCAAEDDAPSPPPTKAEAAQRASKADSGTDDCDDYGWYGDGVCDEFCARPDPDCVCTISGMETDAACANGVDDDCDGLLDCDDPDCTTSLSCIPPPPPPPV